MKFYAMPESEVVPMTVKELSETLSLTEFALPAPDAPVTGGYAGDLLSWVMGRASEEDCIFKMRERMQYMAGSSDADEYLPAPFRHKKEPPPHGRRK